jgi:hypothetical protein
MAYSESKAEKIIGGLHFYLILIRLCYNRQERYPLC